MYYNRTISALVLSVVIIISACSTPHHTNTLIFATNTKFAIDIAADPTGNPSLTVGYKRQEAVWMPLLANQDNNGTPHADNKSFRITILIQFLQALAPLFPVARRWGLRHKVLKYQQEEAWPNFLQQD